MAESKNLLPPSKNTNEHTLTSKDQIIELMSRAGGDHGSIYIVGTFIPGWWSLSGLKGQPLVLVGATIRNKRPAGPLVSVGGCNWDWKATFSPGLSHRPRLNVPPRKSCYTSHWAGDSSPGWWFQPGLNLLLLRAKFWPELKQKNKSLFSTNVSLPKSSVATL